MHQSVLIEDLAVVLCAAAIVTILFQKIKQPAILGYLIAGLIVGPYTPPFSLIDDEAEIKVLAELGVIFLMFSLGLEFTINKLAKVGLPATFTALFEVVFMVLIGYGGGKMMGWSTFESLLMGMALSISSTTIIIKSLENFQLKKQAFASLMVGVLIIEDLIAILMLVFVYTTGTMDQIGTYPLILEAFKLTLMVLSWFLLGFFFIPSLMNKIHSFINQETLTIMSIGLCLFLSALAAYLNYSAALGAFIMGTILAETKQGKRIETLTLPMRDIFLAVFFVSVGMLIDPVTILENWGSVLFFTVLTIVGKIFSATVGAIISGQTLENSLKVGIGMAQIGEFSFIIIGIGGTLFMARENIYSIIVAVATITTFTTPYLIKSSVPVYKYLKSVLPESVENSLFRYGGHVDRFFSRNKPITQTGIGIIRFIMNSLIVAIIFTGTLGAIPFLTPHTNPPAVAEIFAWIIGLVVALPFLWAMLFHSAPRTRIKKWVISTFWWILTIAEMTIFTKLHAHSTLMTVTLLVLAGTFLLLNRRILRNFYLHIEKVFLENLNLKISTPQIPKEHYK